MTSWATLFGIRSLRISVSPGWPGICAIDSTTALALGTCFGVLPDVRGLVMRGPYRIVRHPLYLGELVSALGLVVGTSRPLPALLAWAACVAVQIVRTRYEEEGLRAEFPEYEDYARRTSRLIPGVV